MKQNTHNIIIIIIIKFRAKVLTMSTTVVMKLLTVLKNKLKLYVSVNSKDTEGEGTHMYSSVF
jgi:hypothetical protein